MNEGRCDSCCEDSARLVATAEGFLCDDCQNWWLKELGQASRNLAFGLGLAAVAEARGKRAEEYSDVLRSLASQLGAGGFNASDPIDAEMFRQKIEGGIEMMLDCHIRLVAQVRAERDAERAKLLSIAEAFNGWAGGEAHDDHVEALMAARRALMSIGESLGEPF